MRSQYGIALINPRFNGNVGGSMRAAYNFGCQFVVVTGGSFQWEPTDTVHAERHIPVIVTSDLSRIQIPNYDLVSIERTEDADCLSTFVHPRRALYVFGPENGFVPFDIQSKSKHILSIPSQHSLNLAAAVNIVLYDRRIKENCS